jgi:pyrroline-5-carboxylate reductase
MANSEKQVAVIGAGVMGEALISALITYGISPSAITISEKRAERAAELIARYKVSNADLKENVAKSDLILLVVKPQDMATVLADVKTAIRKGVLVISFVAGKQISDIADQIGTSANPVIRVMPNTPALVGAGMSAISCCGLVTPEQREFTVGFLGAVGKVIEVTEDLLAKEREQLNLNPYNFFITAEPNQLFGIHDWVINNHTLFNGVLTWGQSVLDNCSNACFFPFGISWLEEEYVNNVNNINKK